MYWCCRFIFLNVAMYAVKNQHHSAIAIEPNATTADKKFHDKGTTNVVRNYSLPTLKTSDAIENKERKRDTLDRTISEVSNLTTLSSLDHIEQVTKTVTTPKLQSPKSILLNYLRRISNSKTISGIFVSNKGKNSNVSQTIFQKIAGVYPGLIHTQMPAYTSNETEWTSFVEEVISNWNSRHLVRIQWRTGHPLQGIKNFTDTSNKDEAETRWEDLITDGNELNQIWKEELDKIAPYLHKLQSAGVVTIFDILPIINSKYFIWRGRPGANGTAKLYQITHDHLTKQHNLTSLIWTWSLTADYMTNFEEFWPGNDYVDVASFYVWEDSELRMNGYERLINLVGDDKLLSMEETFTVPSLELLAAQPRWTWFTAFELFLEDAQYNNASNINSTLSSSSVINHGNIDFFNDN